MSSLLPQASCQSPGQPGRRPTLGLLAEVPHVVAERASSAPSRVLVTLEVARVVAVEVGGGPPQPALALALAGVGDEADRLRTCAGGRTWRPKLVPRVPARSVAVAGPPTRRL